MTTPEKEIPVHHLTSEEFQMSTLSAAGPENFHEVHRHNFLKLSGSGKYLKAAAWNWILRAINWRTIRSASLHRAGIQYENRRRGGYAMAISREIFNEACDIESVLTGGNFPFFKS
ncbi:hypothetical protein EJ377_11230 [Chryseobacterium arthrosphaerae]|uniref:Uncharacterized protein n=1 Tax=Chryseobacterium arthrosphaerae TaxID=651561 RepID=A0A432E183_9FLAO|nr:hypothetical protein EJ377_11230 [Chryseobacterium arthrosphaerae]